MMQEFQRHHHLEEKEVLVFVPAPPIDQEESGVRKGEGGSQLSERKSRVVQGASRKGRVGARV